MSNQDHLAEELGRALHRRVDSLHDAPLTVDDVRGRARSIRRRRLAAGGTAVAAAVAVVLIAPFALSGSLGRADSHQPMLPAPRPAHTAHTAVLHDRTVSLPDGRPVKVDLDNADVTQLGLLTDGRILAATSRPQAIRVISTTDNSWASYPVTYNALVVSADDHVAAWVDQAGRVQVLESGQADPVQMAEVPTNFGGPASVDAVAGTDCANGGCQVLVSDGTSTFGVTTSEGYQKVLAGRQLRVTDVSPDGKLWAGTTVPEADHQFGCAELYDPAADRVVAHSCATSGLRFAPDGQHLTGDRGDGNMYGEVDVLDRDLRLVRTFTQPRGQAVSRYAWEDDSHLLLSTAGLQDHQWSLLRVSVGDGAEEAVDGPAHGRNPEMVAEYVLSE